jgi:tRNA1(Val) A37 N6-methylase TrmN6
VLEKLKITPLDSVMDFGSGKGGALITLSRHPFAKIRGVEISPKLVGIAKSNFEKLNIRNITMTVADAADFSDLNDYNYFYFFSPFPSVVMKSVIKNISTSLILIPRKSVIIYFNPVYHDDVVTGSPFVKTNEFNHHEHSYYIYSNRP